MDLHKGAENVTLAPPMARPRKRRRRDLSAMARQANHVLATAVVVFTAAVLLGRLLDPAMLGLQAWLRGHLSATATALVFGPFIVDLPKALLLLLVAFPLGRVTTPRPWPAAMGLVALVYLFDFSIDYVIGAHRITWLQWQALVGRTLLAAAITWGVAWLLGRGRRAAETADRRGAALGKKSRKSKKKETKGHPAKEDSEPPPTPSEALEDDAKPPEADAEPPEADAEPEVTRTESGDPTCKPSASGDVTEGER